VKQHHVIGLTFSTVVLFCCLTACVVGAIVFSTIEVHSKVKRAPDAFLPKKGAIGEIEHTLNEHLYGPVDLNAAKEVKNGLFDRIRARRQAQACQPQAPSQYQLPTQTRVYSYPAVAYSSPVVFQSVSPIESVVVQSTGYEMPIIKPINPLETVNEKDCPTCKKDPRTEIKTGAFICSNCRKSNVGEWYTDWDEDGTPVTFLCRRCHAVMSPEQKEKSFNAYQARQLGKTGNAGLLHQEIGE
jgi:ribosomal protein L37AE/L43A